MWTARGLLVTEWGLEHPDGAVPTAGGGRRGWRSGPRRSPADFNGPGRRLSRRPVRSEPNADSTPPNCADGQSNRRADNSSHYRAHNRPGEAPFCRIRTIGGYSEGHSAGPNQQTQACPLQSAPNPVPIADGLHVPGGHRMPGPAPGLPPHDGLRRDGHAVRPKPPSVPQDDLCLSPLQPPLSLLPAFRRRLRPQMDRVGATHGQHRHQDVYQNSSRNRPSGILCFQISKELLV